MKKADFLVEIHTAELPPKALYRLANSFLLGVTSRLTKLNLSFADAQLFATPRRLAVLIKQLAAQQDDAEVERKGPALSAAWDAEGKPTPACVGFARSCGVSPAQLTTITHHHDAWVGYKHIVAGKSVTSLLPEIVQLSLQELPVPKRMRWGVSSIEFVRPIYSVIMLYGKEVIETTLLNCLSNRLTKGHRFHSKGWISIPSPAHYTKRLEAHFVIADFEKRRHLIKHKAEALVAGRANTHVLIDENLLQEVTGLVEWPVALLGNFDKSFLSVPQEVLISAMQDHQRYFPVVDSNGKLLPHFITMSNIESKDPQHVIEGNQRVLRARLSDATFFFETDKKRPLIDRVETLKQVVFQAKLGTLYDKIIRVSSLAGMIAKKVGVDHHAAQRAGLLSKADLVTEMVGEFPNLQGVMGYYYATHDGELPAVAHALNEHYKPRFSGDTIPESALGCVLALADRLDTLAGVFGIQKAPTADKDPFALRRASLGVLRILIEKKWDLDLKELIQLAVNAYQTALSNQNTTSEVLYFILERLKYWYQDQAIASDVYAAVAALALTRPYDIHRRILAVQQFKTLSEAESLSITNKRVSHILLKYADQMDADKIDENLFEEEVEKILADTVAKKQDQVISLSKSGNYASILTELAELSVPVDHFFETILVMADDKATRENRILLLKKLRELFLHVADIALLQ